MSDQLASTRFGGYTSSLTHGSELPPAQDNPARLGPFFDNMRLRPGGKAIQRLGQTPVGLGPYTDPEMLQWVRLNGVEYRVVVANGSIYDDLTGPVSGGVQRFTPGTPVNGCWFDGYFLMGNGFDPNVRFNGVNVTRLTAPECNASGVILTAGSAGLPNGTYQYACKFVNADGVGGNIQGLDLLTANGGAGGLSPVITVANKQIVLTNLPVCPATYPTGAGAAPNDCGLVDLYRTKDGGVANGVGSTFFFVASLPNGTTTYTDNTADSGLGLEMLNLSSPNTAFPPCQFLQSHLGRLIGAGCHTADSNPWTVHISDSLDATTARQATDDPNDPVNGYQGLRIQVADRSVGTITAVAESFGSSLMIFTGGARQILTGTDLGSFQIYPSSIHGCTSHRSIAQYETYQVWLAPDGVYTFMDVSYATMIGQAFKRISEDVRDVIEGMSAADMANASAVVANSRYYLFWPNGALVYDFLHEAWYRDNPNRFGQATATIFVPAFRNRIYAINNATNGVWQLETGTTDNGNPIPCHLRTPDVALAGPGQQARVNRFGGLFRACAETVSGTLIRGSAQPIYTAVVPLSSGSAAVVPFDISQYPLTLTRVRQHAPATGVSDWFAIDFACDSVGGAFEVIEASFEYLPAGGTNG